MSKTTTDQPLLARTLRDSWYNLLHRAAVSFVPHWDHLRRHSVTPYDLESEWIQLEARIRSLPVDEAHGDVVDRLIESYHEEFVAQCEQEHREREEEAERIVNQGHEHFIRVQQEVADLRKKISESRQLYDAAWQELTGVEVPKPDERPHRIVPIALPAHQAEAEVAQEIQHEGADELDGWEPTSASSPVLNGFDRDRNASVM